MSHEESDQMMNDGDDQDQHNEEGHEQDSSGEGEDSSASSASGGTMTESADGGLQIACADCGTTFAFSSEERAQFAARGFQPPRRCAECRGKRRQRRNPASRKQRRRGGNPGNENRQEARNENRGRPQSQGGGGALDQVVQRRRNTPEVDGNSFVAQAQTMRDQRGRDLAEWRSEHPNEFDEEGTYAAQGNNAGRDDTLDEENFGNSIHYKGPGVDARYGTAWDGGPNFAPWEGAHGYLLTHHEADSRKKDNRSGGGGNDQRRSNQKNRRQRGAGNGQQPRNAQPQREGGSSNRERRNNKMRFEIVCASCNQPSQVPFKPLPDRPVYCRDCHKKMKVQGRAGAEGGEASGVMSETSSEVAGNASDNSFSGEE